MYLNILIVTIYWEIAFDEGGCTNLIISSCYITCIWQYVGAKNMCPSRNVSKWTDIKTTNWNELKWFLPIVPKIIKNLNYPRNCGKHNSIIDFIIYYLTTHLSIMEGLSSNSDAAKINCLLEFWRNPQCLQFFISITC